jgi:hypothetical protein
MTKDCACVVTVLFVPDVRTHLMSSLGSWIRTLFFDLALIGSVWAATPLLPQHNAVASAGGVDVGILYIARVVMDWICSHIGTSVDGLHIVVSGMVPAYRLGTRNSPL